MSKAREIKRLKDTQAVLYKRNAKLAEENQTLLEGMRTVICPYCKMVQPEHKYVSDYSKYAMECDYCEETFLALKHEIKIYEVWKVGEKST